MQTYLKEAQKERETWLNCFKNSNSNPASAQAQSADQIRGNSPSLPEINSDDNIQLLCQKITQDPNLDPAEDSVQFLIVKFLASHIE